MRGGGGEARGRQYSVWRLRQGLKQLIKEFELKEADAFGYMDEVSLRVIGVTANLIETIALLSSSLSCGIDDNIGIVINPGNAVAL